MKTRIAIVALLCASLGSGLRAQQTIPASSGGAGGGSASFGPGQIVVTAAAYGVKADAHWVQDASVTNASGVVTCPSGECNFTTTAGVGQVAWANAGCQLTGTNRN